MALLHTIKFYLNVKEIIIFILTTGIERVGCFMAKCLYFGYYKVK